MEWKSAPKTLNHQWSRRLIRSLIEGGVEVAVVCPGSRNTPLAVALGEQEQIPVHSILDERGAAFFSLGQARQRNAPVLVVSTSGTATAEFHPAVMEADQARVPLIVLTADRPDTLQDLGANQSPRQDHLYAGNVRWFRRLPQPTADRKALRSLGSLCSRALAHAVSAPSGPVHLNQPFSKPLVPDPEAFDGFEQGEVHPLGDEEPPPAPRVELQTSRSIPDRIDLLADRFNRAERCLFLAGPRRPGERFHPLVPLAESLGAPLLADPLSGLRFGQPSPPVIACYDGVLSAGWGTDLQEPDLVLRVGGRMTSRPLRRWVASLETDVIQLDTAPGRWEDAEACTDHVFSWSVESLEGIPTDGLESDPGYLEEWLRLERTFSRTVSDVRASFGPVTEGMILQDLANGLPEGAGMFVSNSTPIRDLDRFGRQRKASLLTAANRGCSGIDGLVSTGLGWAKDHGTPWVLVLGDLALYHDLNGLLTATRCGVPVVILVLNNDGGGIFELLPVREHNPPFEPYVRTRHGLDFEGGANMFEWSYERVDPSDAVATVRSRFGSEDPVMIETHTDAEANRLFRHSVNEQFQSDF